MQTQDTPAPPPTPTSPPPWDGLLGSILVDRKTNILLTKIVTTPTPTPVVIVVVVVIAVILTTPTESRIKKGDSFF
ncbi:hypothetical protein M0804_012175 [Polistes exclamans]|nr:hypothetical protein M0804_012175 [Polistes exclamans]